MGRKRPFPFTAWPPSALTRRFFLQGLISSFAASQLSRIAAALPTAGYPFVEVPPSASKITWVHNAGKSALKHLPEISGAGCAFLDYDNDGWMDIYLVNSGKCGLFHARDPSAKRALPQQSRWDIYRRDREGRCGGAAASEWVSRWAITTMTAIPIFTLLSTGAAFCTTTTATAHSPMSPTKRALPLQDGPRARSGSITTTTAGLTCLSVTSQHCDSRKPAVSDADGAHHYCIPRIFSSRRSAGCFTTTAMAPSPTSARNGIAEHPGQSLGRGRHRHQ